jgi:transglutaminase-like putative cysteine protease
MTGRRRLGLVAASATLLAAAPLSAIFASWTWLMQCILAVGMLAGAAVLARTLRFPVWAQTLSMVGTLLLMLTWMFSSGHELLGLLPSPATFTHFGQLVSQAGTDTRAYGVPVPDRDGLLFVAVFGIGAVAIAVDLLTVVLRRPALAGLPMLAIYSVPVAVYVDSVPVLPFIIGAVGYLWLLVADNVDRVRRFGRRFTGDGRDVDVWEPSPLAAAGRRLAVIGVAAAVLLPLVVPGITTGLLSRLTQSGGGVAGNGIGGGGGRINLFASLTGKLRESDTREMLKVTTNDPQPFYLRIGVGDLLDSHGISSRANSGRTIKRGLPDPRTNPSTDSATYTRYSATVESIGLDQTLAPIYPTTVGVSNLDGNWLYDTGAQALYSQRNTTRKQKYRVDYLRASYTAGQLESAQPLSHSDQLWIQNTQAPADATVRSEVDKLIKGKRTDYDKVRAIYNYFSREHGFSYNPQAQIGTSGSEIASFLTNKSGYCQQYAAAMTWMVRAAGIPARVAFGFTRGTKTGGTYVITNRNAHAWTEVYLDGFGWVPFDATPASEVTGSTRSDWAPDADAAPTNTQSSNATQAPGATSSQPSASSTRPDRDVDAGFGGGANGPGSGGTSTTALLIVGLAALLIALLLVPAVRRKLLRRHRHHVTVPRTLTPVSAGLSPPGSRDVTVTTETVRARADAHAAWDELIDTMLDFRVPVDPTETPRHTAQRLVREADLEATPAQSATLLGSAEERARYARQPLQGGELTAALSQVRKGLARTANRRTRIIAVLMPPSVVLRWRLALADLSANWVGFVGRLREASSRWSPRRLLTNRAR